MGFPIMCSRWRFIAALGSAVLLVGPAIPRAAATQRPGAGWAVLPSPDKAIKLLYWELFDETEVWIRVVPQLTSSGTPIPASLIFSAIFKGKYLTTAAIPRPPETVTLLAQPDPMAVLPVNSFSLRFVADGQTPLDFVERNQATRIMGSCDSCAAQGIITRVSAETLRSLTDNPQLAADVLGFKCQLDVSDLNALRDFARQTKIAPGNR
jgi:hypothetical protein